MGRWTGNRSDAEHRQERVRIETERHRIEGVLTLARDGYRSRVSDVLNASERDFITLTEVTVAPLEGGPVELHPTSRWRAGTSSSRSPSPSRAELKG